MEIKQFAETHRLRVRRDTCGDTIILGKRTMPLLAKQKPYAEHRNHIFDNGDGHLGVCLMFPTKTRWTNAKNKLRAAGFLIRQDGDEEGTALFDPADVKQGRTAIKITGAKPKRQPSPAQLAGLRKALARKRVLALETAHASPEGLG